MSSYHVVLPTTLYPEARSAVCSSWVNVVLPNSDKRSPVNLTPFNEIYDKYKQTNSSIYVRKVNCDPDTFCKTTLENIHKIVYDKSYDYYPTDLIKALEKKDKEPQRTDCFWCSALVGCIYTKSNILESNTDWSIMEPCDFSKEQQNLNLINNASFGDEIKIL